MSAFPLTCKVTTYHTQTYATTGGAPIASNYTDRDKNIRVCACTVLSARKHNIQCGRSLMMLPRATEECTDNGMISLPTFTTVVRSWFTNINRAKGQREELRLNIRRPLFVRQSFSQSGEGVRLLGSKERGTSTVESIQLGHALHNVLETVDTTGEKSSSSVRLFPSRVKAAAFSLAATKQTTQPSPLF